MNILLAGATGLIGGRLAAELADRGHTVHCLVRRMNESLPTVCNGERIRMDYAEVPDQQAWLPIVQRMDAVVNAVGIFRERSGQSFDAIHTRAPMQLFEACAEAGSVYVVQISALGADADARTAYHLSKRAADNYLRRLPVSAAIVQPSLIYAPEGSSARLFRLLATLPVLALPDGGRQSIQPLHVRDVVAGIANLVEQQPAGVQTIAFTGARAITLREYLATLRRRMGLGRQMVLAIPMRIAAAGATAAGGIGGSLIDAETLQMLARGNTAPNQAFSALLGRAPLGPEGFIAPQEARAAFSESLLTWSMPLLRYTLALVWIWTGTVSLWLYPAQESYALLARTGFVGGTATFLLYAAGALDLLLGLLTLALARHWRPYLWPTQLGLIAAYTAIISIRLPEFWIHPYGPILKNLPMLAAILILWIFESRRESTR
jgi:uncharacterized protein YbjT (DUF2867 family)